jgi:hypothetical protein
VGSRSALSNLASIKASTLSDFNRAEAIALVSLGWDKNTSWPLFCASSTNHHHEPVASTAILRLRSVTVKEIGFPSIPLVVIRICLDRYQQSFP